LTAADDTDEELVRRVDAEKRVTVDRIEDWSRARGSCAAEAARAVRAARPESGTVGVFVNTVASALDVAARLRDAEPEQVVRIVCGRMRPADLALLQTEHPGLLEQTGDPLVAFLVSTQSLEVGVDLDLGAIVSELAPASALAQRLGRLNRSGTRRDATFVVLAPRDDAMQDLGPRLLPYRMEQMRDALAWLEALGGDGSPRNVSQTPLPQDDSVPLPAITSTELATLAMTSVVLAADPQVEFYIADVIEREQDRLQIAARDHLGDLPAETIRRALLAAPPRAHELASVPARLPIPYEALRRSWILRSEAGRLRAHQVSETGADFLDGDVLVIPAGSPVLTERIVGTTGGRRADPMNDEMGLVVAGEPDRVIRVDGSDTALVAGLVEGDRVLGSRRSRNELAGILDRAGISRAADRLRHHRYLSELSVTWCTTEEEELEAGLLVIVETGRDGQEARRTVSSEPVTIDAHNAEVAQRMRDIIASLDGVVAQERDDLLVAASLHDGGKRHPCFQRRMGGPPDGPALAKPAVGHVPDQGDGWRHEQLSAAWARAEGAGSLTQIVIAAHHGAGRPMFDDDDVAALREWEACPNGVAVALAELFGPYGAFERERDVLQRELGVHRSAFLEALLRCADMQISSEVTD
jgi:CRISPR-associated endonuclease/helicase Cas3